MRVAIYGAGAMGTTLGAFMNRAGKTTDLITRDKAHVKALREKGAHVTGTVDFTVPVFAYTPEEMSGKYDVIFLMTKQRTNQEVCEFLRGYLSEFGIICTLQNGLPEPSIASVLGTMRTLGCTVSWGAQKVEDGTVQLMSHPSVLQFSLGSFEHESPKLPYVADMLSGMGKVEICENFLGARWAKLAINSAFSSISAITGLTFGEIAKNKETRTVALELLNEAFTVTEACGVTLEKIQGHDIEKLFKCHSGFKKAVSTKLLTLAMQKHKNIVSGMYYDLKKGRPCDIDYINGVVTHSARNFGVSVPLNRKIIDTVHAIERGKLEISPANIALIKE